MILRLIAALNQLYRLSILKGLWILLLGCLLKGRNHLVWKSYRLGHKFGCACRYIAQLTTCTYLCDCVVALSRDFGALGLNYCWGWLCVRRCRRLLVNAGNKDLLRLGLDYWSGWLKHHCCSLYRPSNPLDDGLFDLNWLVLRRPADPDRPCNHLVGLGLLNNDFATLESPYRQYSTCVLSNHSFVLPDGMAEACVDWPFLLDTTDNSGLRSSESLHAQFNLRWLKEITNNIIFKLH